MATARQTSMHLLYTNPAILEGSAQKWRDHDVARQPVLERTRVLSGHEVSPGLENRDVLTSLALRNKPRAPVELAPNLP